MEEDESLYAVAYHGQYATQFNVVSTFMKNWVFGKMMSRLDYHNISLQAADEECQDHQVKIANAVSCKQWRLKLYTRS